jgi:hypothetical protein
MKKTSSIADLFDLSDGTLENCFSSLNLPACDKQISPLEGSKGHIQTESIVSTRTESSLLQAQQHRRSLAQKHEREHLVA